MALINDEPADVIDDVAEMIADWFGRSVTEPDRQLADSVYRRVAEELGF
jgi:hypothetical protein